MWAKSVSDGENYNRPRFAPVAMSIQFPLPIMPKITPSLRWQLLAIFLALSACKAKLPDTKADVLASPVTAAAAAPVKADPVPPHAAPLPATPAQTVAAAPAAAFDISRVPVTQTALPPFPYLDWPSALPLSDRHPRVEEFDRRYVIVGQKVVPVEGRIEWREISNGAAKLSAVGAERNYENALKAIGAVKVDAAHPSDVPEARATSSERLSTDQKFGLAPGGSYSAYLIRTPTKNVWLAISVSNLYTYIMTIDEKAMTQSVGVIAQGEAPAKQ